MNKHCHNFEVKKRISEHKENKIIKYINLTISNINILIVNELPYIK